MDYNRPDGESIDQTSALQAGLDALHAQGGGLLRLAAGIYLSGTLQLRDGTGLWLEKGALLQGIREASAYPILRDKPFGEKPGVIRALLHAEDARNIQLVGEGIIDGGFPEALGLSNAQQVTFRPQMTYFRNCEHVRMEGLTFRNSGFWCLHLMHCRDIQLESLTIRNPLDRINTDGIDPDGCQSVVIRNCDIETGDDCIVLKSTEGEPCEDILVESCTLRTNHGAFKVGTEAIGPIRRLEVRDCLIPTMPDRKKSSCGIALYMKDGSTYEQMHFRGVRMEAMDYLAIMIDTRPRYHGKVPSGCVRDITFENITITGRGRILLEGREESPLHGIRLHEIDFFLDGYGLPREKPLGSARTEHDPALPTFLNNPFAFVFAHVCDLNVSNIRIHEARSGQEPDRGLFFFHDVKGARVEFVDTGIACGSHPPQLLQSCEACSVAPVQSRGSPVSASRPSF